MVLSNKHILLCGGIGSRLTDEYLLPKPLNLIAGIPLIQRILNSIPSDEIVLIAGNHLVKYEIDSVIHHMTNKKVEVIFLERPTRGPLETAFLGIKKSKNIAEDDGLIFYDNDTIYKDIEVFENQNNAIGYINLIDNSKNNPYCFLKIENKKIVSIHEKEQVSRQYAAGIYAFSSKEFFERHAYKLISEDNKNELFMSNIYKNLLENNHLVESFNVGEGICLGTVNDIEKNISKVDKKKLRICFDLDNTLLKYRLPGQKYSDCVPIKEMVDLLKELHSEGHIIIIHTARGMATAKQNEGASLSRVGKDTFDILDKYEIPFDEIFFGKPNADLYIDDKAYNPYFDIYNSIGFPHYKKPKINPTNKFNSILINKKNVVKEGPASSMEGEIFFYKKISNLEIAKYYPKYYESSIHLEKAKIKLEKINGCELYKILSDGLMEQYHLEKIINAFTEIHSTKTEISIEPKDVYENYMGKLKNRIKNNNDYPFPEKYDLIKRIDPIIKEYIFSDNFKLTGVVHGDPWFSNTMIDLKSNIKFLDMKGNIAGKLTTNGDHLTDYAKIMQSLLGFDFIVEDKQIEFTSLKKLKDFFLDAILNKGYEKELINAITVCMISKTISFFPVNSPHKRSIWELATELCKDIKY